MVADTLNIPVYIVVKAMSGVANPAADMIPNQSALAAMPSGNPPATETETPSGKRAHPHPAGVPSGGTAVRLACANVAMILGGIMFFWV